MEFLKEFLSLLVSTFPRFLPALGVTVKNYAVRSFICNADWVDFMPYENLER